MGHSTFADEIYQGMVSRGESMTLLRVDEGLDVFNPSYTTSEENLMESIARKNSDIPAGKPHQKRNNAIPGHARMQI